MASLKAFTMPKWGIEMSEGTVAEWLVTEGKPYAKGELLALIETDKITNEVEAEADGCFVRLVASAGETLPVGALLGVLGPPDASAGDVDAFVAGFKPIDASMPGGDEAPAAKPSEPAESKTAPKSDPAPQKITIAKDVAISPAARIKAESAGLAVDSIVATGREGRITLQDVDKAILGKRSAGLKGPIEVEGQEEIFASPLARRLAVQNRIDLAKVKGTGPRGRICKADVLALIQTSAPPAKTAVAAADGDVEILSMSSMRRTIAARLTEAKTTIPHFYLRRRVRADRLIALREGLGKKASINDYLVRAVALALREVPAVNIQVHGNDIHRFTHADIAIAVATSRGLITPILTSADLLSVEEIATRTADLAQRARAGKLRPEEFQGGSFSVSNLGMFGVEQFDAIINPPQGAILAVGKARPEPIDDDGAIRVVPVFHFSMSCDHRAIDGADGAAFLEALAALVEAPEQL